MNAPGTLNTFVRLGKGDFDDRFSVLKYPKSIDAFFELTESNALMCRLETHDLISHVQEAPQKPIRLIVGTRNTGADSTADDRVSF